MKQKRQQPQYIPVTSLYKLDDNEAACILDKDHPAIMAELWKFACSCSDDINQCYQLLVVVLDRCNKAVQFERSRISKSTPRQRYDNKNERQAKSLQEYIEAAKKTAELLEEVETFFLNYKEHPALKDSLLTFICNLESEKPVKWTLRGKEYLLEPLSVSPVKIVCKDKARLPWSDAVTEVVSRLKHALTAPPAIGALHHYAYIYGPLHFQYPVYWRGGELPSTPRMLALQLATIFRLYSTNRLDWVLGEGYRMQDDGKPMHILVDRIVTVLFPDLCKESPEISKPAERYFKREHPGIKFMHWPEPESDTLATP